MKLTVEQEKILLIFGLLVACIIEGKIDSIAIAIGISYLIWKKKVDKKKYPVIEKINGK